MHFHFSFPVPPVFEIVPQDISIGVGKSLESVCKANGYPMPRIMWNKIDTSSAAASSYAKSETQSKRYIESGEKLRLVNVRLEDAGVYECVAENPLNGLIVSKTFQIKVSVPAHFTQKSSLLTAKYGEKAILVCEAYGAKPISVTWLKQQANGDLSVVPLTDTSANPSYSHNSQRFAAFEKEFNSANNRTVFELHINSVETADSGIYVCKAVNEFGEDVRNIKFTVQDTPSAPSQVIVDQVWSRSVSIRWSPPTNNGNSAILHYIIQYWRDNKTSNTAHRLYEEVTPSLLTSKVLKDKLIPGTSYALRIVASNEFGRGAPSDVVTFMTQEEEPEAPPIDIAVESKGTTALRVKWKAPPKNHWNGQLKGYNIGYRLITASDEMSSDGLNIAENEYSYKDVPFIGVYNDNYQQEFILTGLQKASTYSIVVRAHNAAGNGPLSQPTITTTSNNEPPLPPSVYVSEVDEQKIALKWDQRGNSEDITHYVLYYKDDKSPWLEIAFPVPEKQNQYELRNLEPGTYYQLYMKCMSKRGPSEPSDVITIKTLGDGKTCGLFDPIAQYLCAFLSASSAGIRVGNEKQVPTYLGSFVVIPITVAIVIIVIVCAIAYAYVKNEERKAILFNAGVMSQSPSKNFQHLSCNSTPSRCHSIVSEEGSLTLRYSDSCDRTKPLLARPPVPTVLWAQQQGPIIEENEDFPSPYATLPLKRLTTFNSPPKVKPPSPPEIRRFSQDSHLPSSSNNVFCKADVHNHDDGSDLYDFFKPNVV
ncbi:cell adhesion molecule-like protein 7 [Dinothrombium tinctorium]|uniref:Cell adhesion molecule-like protein 7 n=2 Tax=Dinothrombium tinctorium TaxID=1965070 RepID=A0A3S3P3A9_9ACAR|nr:cell adhesion molecule-like protein 7 [Dinothrombium tinctorium]